MSKKNDNSPDLELVSMREAFGLLRLDQVIELEDILRQQLNGVTVNAKKTSLKHVKPEQVLSFIIPLDAYVPLPEVYHATMVFGITEDNSCDHYHTVSITSYTLELKVGENIVPVKMSLAISSIANDKENHKNIENITDLYGAYREALRVTNNVIAAYKMTPWRHSHNLQPVTALGSPGLVHVSLFDTRTKQITEFQNVMLHEHMMVDVWESREMSKVELSNFAKIHVSMQDGWSMPLWLASKVNEAVDARCLGRDDEAVLLAAHYAELTMRFLLFGTLRTKGVKLNEAKSKAKNHTRLDMLISDLAKELGYSPSKFKEQTKYAVWVQSCRKLRNSLGHEIEMRNVSPQQSFKALDASLIMINKMCEIVNQKYPEAVRDTQWLMSMSGITEAMKRGRKSKKAGPVSHGDSPYNPNINYEEFHKQ